MPRKPAKWLYRLIYRSVKLLSPKYEIIGTENLPEGGCAIIGNHCHMYGPIAAELYTPGPHDTWCAAEMMHLKEVPAYAYRDFWSHKPRAVKPFFKLLSYLIAPLAVVVFNNAHTIEVYHDLRVMSTFRTSVEKLSQGHRVVIFPEHAAPHNNILCDFQENFVDMALLHYKKTGEALRFVPMYLCPALKKMLFGAPVVFDPGVALAKERERVCNALMDEITRLALSLPKHRVVPYPNMPTGEYPESKPLTDYTAKP